MLMKILKKNFMRSNKPVLLMVSDIGFMYYFVIVS